MPPAAPHLLTDPLEREALLRDSREWPSWTLTARQLGDLELILTGAYAPLDGFMTRADAHACTRDLRLADGSPFPAPVLLEVSPAPASAAVAARHLVLRDAEGVPIAVLEVLDAWGDASRCVGGRIRGLQLPHHYDAIGSRLMPADVKRTMEDRRRGRVIACATRRILHRAEYAATAAALDDASGLVLMALLDPAVDHADRGVLFRCHEIAARQFPGDGAVLWVVPLPQRGAAADDLLMTAVAARNAGCTDLLFFGGSLAAHERRAVASFGARLGLAILEATPPRIAGPDGRTLQPEDERRLLARGERLPDWYTFPGIAAELARRHPPAHRRGFTVFFTGLSGSGKSTIANSVRQRLQERTGRPVTLLDGDLVRQHLSSELGFSRRDRDLNIRRIGFVASEITKHGGIAICAPIAPYESVRHEVREMIEPLGGFVLVFVDTPLEICEARDRKGLYAKARAGLIAEFTGVSDPYEAPADADVVIRTVEESADRAADRVIAHLEERGFLGGGE